MSVWLLFTVPCPTPLGESADDLMHKREVRITPEMQSSARDLGCRFHRCWVSSDSSMFVALTCWENRDGARQFYETWDIQDEAGEITTVLEGDCGLVPVP